MSWVDVVVVVLLRAGCTPLAAMHLLSWLINVQTKSSNVNIAVTPEQKSAENGLCRKHRESWNVSVSNGVGERDERSREVSGAYRGRSVMNK